MYQLTAMVAHILNAHLTVPFMVARANLTTAPSHLGPQVLLNYLCPAWAWPVFLGGTHVLLGLTCF